MNVGELVAVIDGQLLTNAANQDAQVTSGYCCDLLSWVMSHGKAEMAWVTVQTHMNVIAVATLLDMSCVIIPEGIHVEEDVVAKANEEGIALISCADTAYTICGKMSEAGIGRA